MCKICKKSPKSHQRANRNRLLAQINTTDTEGGSGSLKNYRTYWARKREAQYRPPTCYISTTANPCPLTAFMISKSILQAPAY